MVQAVSAYGADQTFGVRILPGTLGRGVYFLHARGRDPQTNVVDVYVSYLRNAIEADVEAFRQATWNLLLEGYALGDRAWTRSSVAIELSRPFRAAMFAALSLYPDVRPALDRLALACELAVITNGLGTAQREKLAHFGIDGHFQSVIASAEVGTGKPARLIFAHALRAMDVSADEAVMIGDSLEGDIEGALAAGMHALWLNRHGIPNPGHCGEVASLA